MEWLTNVGALVSRPLFENPDYDLIADFGEGLVRVQVKTSTCWRNGRYEVTTATRGGNQSWSGLVKRLDTSRCDALFVHVGDGRRWYIPSSGSRWYQRDQARWAEVRSVRNRPRESPSRA